MRMSYNTREAMIQGINRFLFYAWNFGSTVVRINHGDKEIVESVPRAVAEAKWNCSVSHMVEKWLEATESGNADAYFPRFYAELSTDNRHALLEWIIENYSGEAKAGRICYEAVDLGLPSGLLWADRNVGAETPEGCGHYFAWGEVEGYGQDTSDGHLLNWDTCPWGKSTPPMNTLDAEHDAATQNMGADWRMPDERDFEELLNNCTTIWTTRDGKYGRLFTSKVNGNTLFFPAAGIRDGSSLDNAGAGGCVWSRSLYGSRNAYYLYFDSSNCNTYNYYRYRGCSVRGVRAKIK